MARTHTRGVRRRTPLWVVLAIATTVIVGACGSDDARSARRTTDRSGGRDTGVDARPVRAPLPRPVQTIDVVGTEYAFALVPDTDLRPGWTEVRFQNEGGEPHQIMFARLKDDADLAALAAAGAGDSSGAAAIEFVDMIGGVSYIGPGRDITAMVDLPTGTVLAMCYVPDGHGVAHALMGMSTTLTVAEDPATAGARSDPADEAGGRRVRGTIRLTPDGYEIPQPLGRGWYHVVNTDVGPAGTGLHELALMRLDRPLSEASKRRLLEDIAANRTPEVALDALGGLGAISPGFDGYLFLDLPAGHYLAVDFMPDAGNPRPHLLDGYAAAFEG
jgi:hypothetical protein